MKFNRVELWKILKPWIDFDEGEIGDCPELGEMLAKVVEHEKGFDKELRRKQGYPHHYHKNEYWVRINEILGVGDKTKENTLK